MASQNWTDGGFTTNGAFLFDIPSLHPLDLYTIESKGAASGTMPHLPGHSSIS